MFTYTKALPNYEMQNPPKRDKVSMFRQGVSLAKAITLAVMGRLYATSCSPRKVINPYAFNEIKRLTCASSDQVITF